MMKIERRCFFLNGHKNKSWFCFLFQSFVAAFNSLVAPVETKPRVECSEQQLKKRQKFSSLSLCTVKCCSRRDIHRRLLKYLSHSSSCARHHSLYSASLNEWKKNEAAQTVQIRNSSRRLFFSPRSILKLFDGRAYLHGFSLWLLLLLPCVFRFISFQSPLFHSLLLLLFIFFANEYDEWSEWEREKNWESSDEILILKYINICEEELNAQIGFVGAVVFSPRLTWIWYEISAWRCAGSDENALR